MPKISAGRTLPIHDVAEAIVIAWVERQAHVPVHLLDQVRQYRELATYWNYVACTLPTQADLERMNSLYDHLIAVPSCAAVLPRELNCAGSIAVMSDACRG